MASCLKKGAQRFLDPSWVWLDRLVKRGLAMDMSWEWLSDGGSGSGATILDPDSDPAWPKSSGSDRIRIHNTGLNTKCCVDLHELQVHFGGINSEINSRHSLPRVIISSHGNFSLERSFYTWFFISSHFSKKYFKYKNICLQNYFFVSKTPFSTSHKLIF